MAEQNEKKPSRFMKRLEAHLRDLILPVDADPNHKVSARELKEAKEAIADFLGIRYENFLEKFPTRKRPLKRPFPLSFIRELVLATGIDESHFVVTDDDLEGGGKESKKFKPFTGSEPIYTPYFLRRVGARAWPLKHCDESSDSRQGRAFCKKYLAWIKPYYTDKAVQSIYVSEYLGKGSLTRPGHHLQAYFAAQKELFSAIESSLDQIQPSGSEKKYIRLLRVPVRLMAGDEEDAGALGEKVARCMVAMKFCRRDTFEHLARCLRFYPKNVTICIVPARLEGSFALLDRKNDTGLTLVMEWYQLIHDHVRHELLLPSMLSVQACTRGKHPLTDLVDTFEKEVQDAIHPDNMLDFEDLKYFLLLAQDDLKDEFDATPTQIIFEEVEAKLEIWEKVQREWLDQQNKQAEAGHPPAGKQPPAP